MLTFHEHLILQCFILIYIPMTMCRYEFTKPFSEVVVFLRTLQEVMSYDRCVYILYRIINLTLSWSYHSVLFQMTNCILLIFKTNVLNENLCKNHKYYSETIETLKGAGRSSEVERSIMVRWVVGSILHGVDPLSYFSFLPVLHDWCN